MKMMYKTALPFLLLVFLIGAACNGSGAAPAGERAVLSVTRLPSDSQGISPEALGEAGKCPTPPQNTGTDVQVFLAEKWPDSLSGAAAMAPAPEGVAPQTGESRNAATETAADCAGCEMRGNAAFEEILLNLINQERRSRGLNELVLDARLTGTARGHSQDMALQNYFCHTGSDGSTPFERIGAGGYPYEAAGENIYAGSGPYDCAQEAFKAWMQSAGHKEVMLHPIFEEVGIGYAFHAESTYGGYFTAVFGSR